MMVFGEKMNKADVIKFSDLREKYSSKRINFKTANKIYFPPLIDFQTSDNLFQKDVHLFKILKQFIDQTKKKLDPKEIWSRLDKNIDYDDKNERKFENKFKIKNPKKKRKYKKCKCECENRDLIITIPKYKYKDIPLGKEISSKHLRGNQFESLPIDIHSNFESIKEDGKPQESTRLRKLRLKQGSNFEKELDRRNDHNLKRFKNKLPDKNFSFSKNKNLTKNIENQHKNLDFKNSLNKQNKSKIVYESEKDEYADLPSDEPFDFNYNEDSSEGYNYLEGNQNEYDIDEKESDYNEYLDSETHQTDIIEDYNFEEENFFEDFDKSSDEQ